METITNIFMICIALFVGFCFIIAVLDDKDRIKEQPKIDTRHNALCAQMENLKKEYEKAQQDIKELERKSRTNTMPIIPFEELEELERRVFLKKIYMKANEKINELL